MVVGYDDQSLLLQIIGRIYRLQSLAFKQRDAVMVLYEELGRKRRKKTIGDFRSKEIRPSASPLAVSALRT